MQNPALGNNFTEKSRPMTALNIVQDLSAVYIIAWAILPIMATGSLFRIIAVVCSALFFAIAIIQAKVERSLLNYLIYSVLLIVVYVTVSFIGTFNIPFSKSVNLIVFCVIGFISIFYARYHSDRIRQFSILIVALFLIVTLFSLLALRGNPNILRDATGLVAKTGIELFAGGYGYVFGCVLLNTFLIYDLKTHKKKATARLIELACIVLFSYLILNAGYTTAIILAVGGAVLALSLNRSNLSSILLVGISLFASMYVFPKVLQYIVANVDLPGIYRSKFIYLSSLFDLSSGVTYADSTRGAMFMQGINAIIDYPLVGSVLITGATSSGGHQQIIDVLANYGLLYAVLFYRVVLLTPFSTMKSDNKLRILYIVLITALGLLDTFDYTTMAVPLFLGTYIASKKAPAIVTIEEGNRYENRVDNRNGSAIRRF